MSQPDEGTVPAVFQARVRDWMLACFGPAIAADKMERNHRFIEEALELVQANGCTREEARQLVEYVYDRPAGEAHQEAGGALITLAALCDASSLDLDRAGEDELARVWTKVDQIRAKQAAKPKHSPLPVEPQSPDMEARIRKALVAIVGHDEECDRLYDETDPCGCTNRLTTPEEVRGLNVLRDLLRESEAKIAALRSSVVSESGKAWEAAERRWEESEARYVARIEEAERKLAESEARRQEAEEKAAGMAALLYSSKPLVVLRDRLAAAENRIALDNAVCLCGCPSEDHESYGEDGESCEDESHECMRVPVAVLTHAAELRTRLAAAEKERDKVTLKLAAAQRVFAETADAALASDRAAAQVIESLTDRIRRAKDASEAIMAGRTVIPKIALSGAIDDLEAALLAAKAWLDGQEQTLATPEPKRDDTP